MLEGTVSRMTSKNEPVGVWVRVSTGGQDEANQVPDVERHCSERGYEIKRRYELNDKSASKGEQQDTLDAMLADMREGTIKVLVCWHSDRLERRGVEAVFRLLSQVRDALGRFESVQEPLFGGQDFAGQLSTATYAAIAQEKSAHISEQVKIAHNQSRANGSPISNVPWGFTLEGPKYHKTMVPTDLCKEIVPQIFARCIAGDSLRTIAAWLDSQGIPSPKGKAHWNESTIRWTIQQRAYAGRLLSPEGQTVARCEAVVLPDVYDQANSALKTRPKRGPATEAPPLLAKLKCARCEDSPMYRVHPRKDYWYYRCSGRGPQRKGCKNMIPLDVLEKVVHVWITIMTDEPHYTREWAEGQNWDSEISDVKQDLREAVEAERFEDLPELQAKLAELRSRESIPGHWEKRYTGMTVGAYFHSLDYDGQREYLKTRDIRAEKVDKQAVRLVIDGHDYGVIRLAA
jgi:DNA invertase Pin-like site-specific DNA recombinase